MGSFGLLRGAGILVSSTGNICSGAIFNEVELFNYDVAVEALVKRWGCSVPTKYLGGERRLISSCCPLENVDVVTDVLGDLRLQERNSSI